MIPLIHFNQLSRDDAVRLLAPCVAIDAWATALMQARPYPNLTALMAFAQQKSLQWGAPELALALRAHPRIGEKPAAEQEHAEMSRQEQAAVNDRDAALIRALAEGNARYEARFGRVFLIRAKGRSGEEILRALTQRLSLSPEQETEVALGQLREITLLRLTGVIGE
ncbi:2-oxo-4-hydroxy-4-carboxy-5-ureidoimidazoline decarboxylase [Klebsiella sp. I138]|uniref:2-oxo-4-hydroxy-4-carboxy-5-ureidoimidazoline decarboxylase n=1 Tax=Klebsiella sp. I138 TaxID=2755385 RepID=UPI003DA8CFA5